jgi:hypothetical protein
MIMIIIKIKKPYPLTQILFLWSHNKFRTFMDLCEGDMTLDFLLRNLHLTDRRTLGPFLISKYS